MIEEISIKDVASYGNIPERLHGLSIHNFIYGANGSGKTTISRIIADESSHPTCAITWKGGIKLDALVYNKDFVERTFGPSTELKGIFTLGEKDKSIEDEIIATKAEQDAINMQIENLKSTLSGDDGLGGKTNELVELESNFQGECWNLKQKYDADFHGAFHGLRNSKEKFKAHLISEANINVATIKTLRELEEKAASIFGEAPEEEPLIPELNFQALLDLESNPILPKKVIGKSDVE